jgi:hypothetical protein
MSGVMFFLLTVSTIVAALIVFFGALNERMRLYPAWHKVGLIMASFGLVAQALRNIHFLMTGVSPTDADLPLWALKDLGIAIIAYYYLAICVSAHLKNKRQAAAPVSTAKKAAAKSTTQAKRLKK